MLTTSHHDGRQCLFAMIGRRRRYEFEARHADSALALHRPARLRIRFAYFLLRRAIWRYIDTRAQHFLAFFDARARFPPQRNSRKRGRQHAGLLSRRRRLQPPHMARTYRCRRRAIIDSPRRSRATGIFISPPCSIRRGFSFPLRSDTRHYGHARLPFSASTNA